ncbi:ribonuclease E/G [Sinomonas atrocyanea]|uniref:Rne/Rng family ribonuclease n=2 Tax=Sinomonas atrocyanea TaxID=37927 RepID=UPI0035939E19
MDMEQQPGAAAPDDATVAEQKPRRTTRRRSASSPAASPAVQETAQETAEAGATTADAPEAQGTEAAELPAKPKRATRSRRAAAAPKDAPTEQGAAEQSPAEQQGAPADTAPREDAAPEQADAAQADAAGKDAGPIAEAKDADGAEPTGQKAPTSRRRRTSARAAAVKEETRRPERAAGDDHTEEPEAAPAAAPAAGSRAKSSVRARRRSAARSGAADEAPAQGVQAAVADEPRPAEEASAEAPVAKERVASEAARRDAVPHAAPAADGAAAAALRQEAPAPETADGEAEESAESGLATLFREPISPTSMIFQAPDLSTVLRPVAAAEPVEDHEEEHDEDEESELSGRRRRRGRGRRGRTRGTESSDEQDTEDGEPGEESEEITSRRRRRRRRGDADLELEGGLDDDPPGTVTRVRAPRTPSEAPSTRVQSVRGSTRLEAKKQRRRESRESGRRRHVITEAEFLARRESVDRQMVVRQKDDRIQIAVLEDGVLAEHFVSKTQQDSLIGNVYLGRVQNVLPSMEAAFVDIGRGRNAVLYAGEVNWDAAGLDGAPRRIENALKSGDSVLVQVTKDPVGHKGARLTSQISLPGRYLVYVPGGSMTGISRKLPDVERARLKKILKDRLPEDAGVIVRTAAEGASEEELTHDINRLRAQWESIQEQASSTKVLAPELLYGEPDLTIKVVRDVFNEDFSKLIVSGEEAWDTIEAYVTYVAPDLLGRLEKYESDEDVFAHWRIDEQIHKALDRKVFLPSGGSLVIDRTEAMTVVDVNTGKFTGSGGNLEETVTKNNLEAAEEIVRQLRLRDIGGIIVIDFIDMVLESNRDLVLRRLVECLGRDRTKHQVAEVTSLGLVQMTRKRMGTGLLEVFSENCEVCGGRGVITHEEPVERGSRPAAPAPEHQAAPRTEAPASGSGRKRRRRGTGQQPEAQAAPAPAPAPAAPPVDDAERQARAQATRAALAAVAAAAHAAHVHDGDQPAHAEHPDGGEHVPAEQAPVQQAPAAASAGHGAAGTGAEHTGTGHAPEPVRALASSAPAARAEATHGAPPVRATSEGEDGRPVLTIGGERIEIPHGDLPHEAPAPAPALSLDALSQAFDQLTGERHVPDEAEPRPGRKRRSRGARSGQGSAEVTRVEETAGAVGGQTRSAAAPTAPAQAGKATPDTPKDEGGPMILGVGVPASEL